MAWEALAGAGIAAAGGVAAAMISRGGNAGDLYSQALARYGNIEPATLDKVAAEMLGPTELAKIQADPRLRDEQYGTLGALDQEIDNGGLSLVDKALLSKNLNAASARTAANRGAIRENMAARGTGGSGAELAMQMGNAQADANTNAQTGLDVASQAQKRYLDSILQRGDYASKLRGQEYGEKSNAATAQDAINRYNTGAKQQATYFNQGLDQQRWENDMALANSEANATNKQAAYTADRSQRTAAAIGGAAQGVGNAAAAYGAYQYGQNPKGGTQVVNQDDDTPYYLKKPY